MLSPKRVKYRKVQRGNIPGNATRCNAVSFGEFALVSMDRKWITNREIEAARIAMNRHIKRGGKLWIRIYPDKPYSKKPADTRMGKGKGATEYWVAVVKPGTVMFELGGVDRKLAEEAMILAGAKLPIKTKFVVRHDLEIGD
jgi:large subunit ribosomal protein L16